MSKGLGMGTSSMMKQVGLQMLCLSIVAVLVLLLILSNPAYARSYEVKDVSIDATIETDGSLEVSEQHQYYFDGSFGGIYWELPRGSYEGRSIEPTLESVEVQAGGQTVAFSEGNDGKPGTYELSKLDDAVQLKLYWPAENETLSFTVDYSVSKLASRWADTSELYWQYVPADPDSEVQWQNITATVHLPVPSGETVTPGENVRAWGHGPLDSELDFRGNDIVYHSPGVGTAEFLEARIAFPGPWLSEVVAADESRLDTIRAEEDEWAKNANAQRRHARLIAYGLPALLSLIGIGSALAAKFGKQWRRGKGPKPSFKDKYFRDVPTNDHPAVLGMLYNEGYIRDKEFTATVMRLTDKGMMSLDAVTIEEPDKRGKTHKKAELRLMRGNIPKGSKNNDTRAGGKAIDDAAMHFLFDVVGDKHKHIIDSMLCGPQGEPYVLASFFKETAKDWPQAYENGYSNWDQAVRSAYNQRKFVTGKEDRLFPGVLGLADFALAVILATAGMFLEVPGGLLTIGFILCFAGGIYCVMSDEDESIYTFSQEAVDIKAQLGALKRWLCDFTRLEEAIPTDVVLWDRLLVMATILGVAEEVIKQLKVHAPKLVEDLSAYGWYEQRELSDMPLNLLAESIGRGRAESSSQLYHHTSTSAVASSHDSSSRGSGGGFSGGGGGGFSGGGRGGAF